MATSKTVQKLCVVRLGFDEYLLPAAAGLKVAELMQQAKPVSSEYIGGRGYVYSEKTDERAEVQWAAVQQGQLVQDAGRSARAARAAKQIKGAVAAPETGGA